VNAGAVAVRVVLGVVVWVSLVGVVSVVVVVLAVLVLGCVVAVVCAVVGELATDTVLVSLLPHPPMMAVTAAVMAISIRGRVVETGLIMRPTWYWVATRRAAP
jgi:hypothetical protein